MKIRRSTPRSGVLPERCTDQFLIGYRSAIASSGSICRTAWHFGMSEPARGGPEDPGHRPVRHDLVRR